MKKKLRLQEEQYTCAISCISMILDYYHIDYTQELIKKKARLLLSGTTMLGIIRCFAYFGIEAKGYKASLDQIIIDKPVILLVKNHQYHHFIVCFQLSRKGYYECFDPDGGKKYYTKGELASIYLEKCICIQNIIIQPSKPINHLKDVFIQHLKRHKQRIFLYLLLILSLMFSETLYHYVLASLMKEFNERAFVLLMSLLFIYVLLNRWFVGFQINNEKENEREYYYPYLQAMTLLEQQYFLSHKKQTIITKMNYFKEVVNYISNLESHVLFDGFMILLCLFYFYWMQRDLMFFLLVFSLLMILFFYFIYGQIEIKSYISYKYLQALLQKVNDTIIHLNTYRLFQNIQIQKEYSDYEKYNLLEKKLTLSISQTLTIFGKLLEVLVILLLVYQQYDYANIYFYVYLISSYERSLIALIADYQIYPRMKLIFEQRNEMELKQESTINKIEYILLEDLSFSYGYTSEIIENANFVFQHHYYLIGENGNGKSTLLKILNNEFDYYEGHLYYNDIEGKQLDRNTLINHICFLESEMEISYENTSELFPLDFLLEIGMVEFYQLEISHLSRGQKQIVVFLYSILKQFDVYLLDECFNHIDEAYYNKIIQLLEGDLFEDKIVIYCNHQVKKIPKNFESVIMRKKKIERN